MKYSCCLHCFNKRWHPAGKKHKENRILLYTGFRWDTALLRKTDKNGKDLKEIDQDMICKILKLFFFIFDDIVHLTKQFGLCILAVYWWPAVKTYIYNYSWIKHFKNWKNITTYFQLKSYSFPLSQYLVMLH